jgi:aldehyde:ferredoxin oxidoreductase
MSVKKQEMPTHEPRGKRSLLLSYATSPTGADHMEAPHDVLYTTITPELHSLEPLGLTEPLSHLDMSSRKVRTYCYTQKLWNMYNAVGMCAFVGVPVGFYPINELVECVRGVTGWDTSLWEMLKVGERGMALARLFNCREGFTTDDDRLAGRVFEKPRSGVLKDKPVGKEAFEKMLALYYDMVGWDPKSGLPHPWKLAELDLEWALPSAEASPSGKVLSS